ncbi:Acyl-lipid (8-3)-desaturase B (Delta(5) fatty acid desaturase B) (Delta-5 fatty acid desaturase B), partial [Durusdinium trenchii]
SLADAENLRAPQPISHPTVQPTRSRERSAMASITREEVAKHNKAEDAWIIVDGDVYDVTKFAGVHPGGTQILLEYAGKDA